MDPRVASDSVAENTVCREVTDPEVHKWRMAYWDSPSKNVERRNALMACQEVSGISMDPEVSLQSKSKALICVTRTF